MVKKRQYQNGGSTDRDKRLSEIENGSPWGVQDYIKYRIPEPGLGLPLDAVSMELLGASMGGLGISGVKYAGKKTAEGIFKKAMTTGTGKTMMDANARKIAGEGMQKFRGGYKPGSSLLKSNPNVVSGEPLTHRILTEKAKSYLKSDLSKQEHGGYLPKKYQGGGETPSYDINRAKELGYVPDQWGHLPSRDYKTGRILKKPWHPTFQKGLEEDRKLGYRPFMDALGNVYTISPNDIPAEGYFAPKQKHGGYLPNKALGGGLQGALAGAGTGAAIGAPFGGIGAPIGAGIGFLVGGAAGWINEDEQIKQQRAQEDAARLAMQKQQEFIKSLNQPALNQPASIPNVMNYGYRTNFKHGGDLPMAPYHNMSQKDYDAAYNAEGGEIIENGNQGSPQPIGDQGGVKQIAPGASKVMGPSHAGGGVDLSGGAYVFSDKLKTSEGNTFAKEAEGLYKQFNEAQKLYSKSNDRFMKTAYTRTIGKIQKKLNDLRAEQEQERGADETLSTMKKGGWIQGAVASIKRRGTEGVCTGSKFGGPGCPPGSRRYALAQTFKKMARNKEDGGFIDPEKEKEYNMLKSKLVKMALGGSLSKTNKTPLKQMADGGGLAYAGMAANAIGPIYDIAQSFRKTEPVNYPRISVSNVNYGKSIQEQVSELDRQREAAVSAARNNAISSQEYLQMVRAIDSDIAIKKQRAISGGREQEANVNAQMANQIGAQNAQIRMAEEQARSQSLASRQMAGRAGAYNLGAGFATATRDITQQRQNEDMMKIWGDYLKPVTPSNYLSEMYSPDPTETLNYIPTNMPDYGELMTIPYQSPYPRLKPPQNIGYYKGAYSD